MNIAIIVLQLDAIEVDFLQSIDLELFLRLSGELDDPPQLDCVPEDEKRKGNVFFWMMDELWNQEIDGHHAKDDEEDGQIHDVDARLEKGNDSFGDATEIPL